MRKIFTFPLMFFMFLFIASTVQTGTVRVIHINPLGVSMRDVEEFTLTKDGENYLGVLRKRPQKDQEILLGTFELFRMDKTGRIYEKGMPITGPTRGCNNIVYQPPSNNNPSLYPQLIVRDKWAERCPYILVKPNTLRCVSQQLTVEPKPDGALPMIPFEIRGVHVFGDEIWVEGMFRGYLAHRWDEKTHTLIEDALPLEPLVQALKKADHPSAQILRKVLHEVTFFSDTNSFFEKFTEVTNDQTSKVDSYHLSLMMKSDEVFSYEFLSQWIIPPTLSFDWVRDGHHAYVFFLRPMTLIKMSWPEGEVEDLFFFDKQDLPPEILNFPWVYLYDVTFYQGSPMIWLQFDSPLTYERARLVFPPKVLKGLEHYLDRKGKRKPKTVVGSYTVLGGIRVNFRQKPEIHVFLLPHKKDEYYIIPKIFAFGDKKLNVLLVDEDLTRYYMGQLILEE